MVRKVLASLNSLGDIQDGDVLFSGSDGSFSISIDADVNGADNSDSFIQYYFSHRTNSVSDMDLWQPHAIYATQAVDNNGQLSFVELFDGQLISAGR